MTPGPALKIGVPMFLLVFVTAAILLYGGAKLVEPSKTASAGPDLGGPPGGPVNLTVIAKNTSYNIKTIQASPGVPVSIALDNEDAGVLHNIAFYTSKAATTKIGSIDPFQGTATQNLNFTAPSAPGTYYYRCDVHPDQMNGSFVVK